MFSYYFRLVVTCAISHMIKTSPHGSIALVDWFSQSPVSVIVHCRNLSAASGAAIFYVKKETLTLKHIRNKMFYFLKIGGSMWEWRVRHWPLTILVCLIRRDERGETTWISKQGGEEGDGRESGGGLSVGRANRNLIRAIWFACGVVAKSWRGKTQSFGKLSMVGRCSGGALELICQKFEHQAPEFRSISLRLSVPPSLRNFRWTKEIIDDESDIGIFMEK